MSLHIQTCKSLLRTVSHRSQQALCTYRNVHVTTQSPLNGNRARLSITRQRSSALAHKFSGAQDLCVRKRRRYSQGAAAPLDQNTSRPALDDGWETVDSSTLLVRPRKAKTKNRDGSTLATRPIIARSRRNVETGEQDRRAFKRGTRDAAGHLDAGRLVAKENRALFLPKSPEDWQVQKKALVQKFKGEGWNPRKKLSPDTIEGIRALHDQDPERYSTPTLSEHFKVSPEAIRRILKSKWRPSEAQMQDRRERWARRHDRIWDQKAELGLRPKRTKDRQLEGADDFEENLRAKEILDAARNT